MSAFGQNSITLNPFRNKGAQTLLTKGLLLRQEDPTSDILGKQYLQLVEAHSLKCKFLC